jgi:hypothetical protein
MNTDRGSWAFGLGPWSFPLRPKTQGHGSAGMRADTSRRVPPLRAAIRRDRLCVNRLPKDVFDVIIFRRVSALLVLVIVSAGTARADGLLYKLPKDCIWARYQIDGLDKNVGQFDLTSKVAGTVYIASVGQTIENDLPCRWIEVRIDLRFAVKIKNKMERMSKSDLCKLLIPEKYLAKSQSPLDHVLRAWYRSEADDSSDKMDNPRDGRTALPLILAGPLKHSERLGIANVESKLGKRVCDGERGTIELTSTRGGALPNLRESYKVECRLHPDSPFGVVTSRWTLDSQRETRVWDLRLVDFGDNATSKMPDAK